MTSPDYRPPPAVGWWVKAHRVIFGEAATLTRTGQTGTVTVGPRITGGGATLTYTGGAGLVTTGPVVGGQGALSRTGLTGQLQHIVRGAGALTRTGQPGVVGAKLFDNFNRADSTTSAGPDWVNRNGTMGVQGLYAYPVSGYAFVSNTRPVITDDVRVSLAVGTQSGFGYADEVFLILGANSAGECVIVDFDNDSAIFKIQTLPTWGGSPTTRASMAGTNYDTYDSLSVERIGNVYTVKKNGAWWFSWTDTTNIVPRNSSHRFVGFGSNQGGAYRRVDNFSAEDI